MGAMEAAVAIYVLAYLAVMMIICAVGYFKNYAGKKDDGSIKGDDSSAAE